jgi:DNA ligase-4
MSLNFRHVCELFEQLAGARAKGEDAAIALVKSWVQEHDEAIPREGPQALALLSCLLPARRADRVCGLREGRLRTTVQNAQGLGKCRMLELQRWQSVHGLDFASAVEQVLSATDTSPSSSSAITIDEVDYTLDQIASTCAFSSPEIRQRRKGEPTEATAALTRIFRRADSLQTKWLIRLIQEDLRPAAVPEITVLRCFHILLPACLAVRNSLHPALQLLNDSGCTHTPSYPSENAEYALTPSVLPEPQLEPQLGIMVGLPAFEKSRSIEHSCQLVGKRSASVERKYDGEYCQIHVDISTGDFKIKIFSKSGRDSTADRIDIHDAIKRCLRIGTLYSQVRQRCIIVGELLVWNERRQAIMPFYKIRKYVLRAGHRIGCAQDSPPSEDEHLMIMLYDVLLVDNINCLSNSYESRRQRLQKLIHPLPGLADIGIRTEIDFRQPDAASRLRDIMSIADREGWEGLVVKRSHECYLQPHGRAWQVKLKKDYIPGLADSADLVVIGGRRDPKQVQVWGLENLSWTTFHIACQANNDRVQCLGARPTFRIVGTVTRPCISLADLKHLNRIGKFCQVPFTLNQSQVAVHCNLPRAELPTELFCPPVVVEVIGAGFDRPSDEDFFSLRFPRITKIHEDRLAQDAVT